MTVPGLIDGLLGRLLREHYRERMCDFMGEKQALQKAIARYGYECAKRGWQFEAPKLYAELTRLLDELKATVERGTRIRYLPVYLEHAVDKSIRLRAEQLSADAKKAESMRARVLKIMERAESMAVRVAARERSATETLALVYRDLAKRGRARRAAKRAGADTGDKTGRLV